MDTSLRGAICMGMRKGVQSFVDRELDGGVGLLGVDWFQYWEYLSEDGVNQEVRIRALLLLFFAHV